MARKRAWMSGLVGVLLAVSGVLGCEDGQGPTPQNEGRSPDRGGEESVEYVSADVPGRNNGYEDSNNSGTSGGYDVNEEFDSSLGSTLPYDRGQRLSLSSYRGLQVVDLAGEQAPAVLGRLRLPDATSMIRVGADRLLAVSSGRVRYFEQLGFPVPENTLSSMLLLVDLADVGSPRLVDHVLLEGLASLVEVVGPEGSAPTIVALSYAWGSSRTATCVARAYTVGATELEPSSTRELGTDVAFVRKVGGRLLVGRYGSLPASNHHVLSVLSWSSVDGTFAESSPMPLAGHLVAVGLHGRFLRTLSQALAEGQSVEHLQVFDLLDAANPALVDDVELPRGTSTAVSTFAEDYVVLWRSRDEQPVRAFDFLESGEAREQLSGLPGLSHGGALGLFDDTRLVTAAPDDADGALLDVRLFTVEDLTASQPQLDHATASVSWPASVTPWPDGRFMVWEGASAAVGTRGELETALMATPFLQVDASLRPGLAGLQLFTLSPQSVTARGVVEHPDAVQDTSLTAERRLVAASLAELRLHDVVDPDAPALLGTVPLAPYFRDFKVVGSHAVRVRSPSGERGGGQPDLVEVIPLDGAPDGVSPVAAFEVPAGAQLFQSGAVLVSVDAVVVGGSSFAHKFETTVSVHDLSTPNHPVRLGGLVSRELRYDELESSGSSEEDSPSVPIRGVVVGPAVVFPRRIIVPRPAGAREYCSLSPVGSPAGGAVYQGAVLCVSENNAPRRCSGEIEVCRSAGDVDAGTGATACEPVDPSTIQTREDCRTVAFDVFASRYAFDVLDITDPEAPRVGAHLEMEEGDDAVGLVVETDKVHVCFKRAAPDAVNGPSARYFFETLTLSDPQHEVVSTPVNIPGELVAISGETVVTRDRQWESGEVLSSIHTLTVADGVATLTGSRTLGTDEVRRVVVDGGRIYVARAVGASPGTWPPAPERLTILARDLSQLGEVDVGPWAQLNEVEGGRALLWAGRGVLVVDLTDPAHPVPQGYVSTVAWPHRVLLHEDALFLAAGRHGIYKLAVEGTSLLPRR